jgi:orotidine-5'-phosphate decarboxylase
VCSVEEARAVRGAAGPESLIVTPGIRFAGGAAHDQRRVATPRRAGQEGADAMVLGRAVWEAPDPRAALRAALREYAGGVAPGRARR